jgi:hypothetical protein
VIEDMILNGNLRKLDIVLRESFITHSRKRTGEEDKLWVYLKQLCKDPYLESVTLKTRSEGWYDLLPAEREKHEKDVTFLLNN